MRKPGDAVQKVKCKESIIERTLGITPRNLRLHTQVLFASHKGKKVVAENLFVH